jgi:hypothetical protein
VKTLAICAAISILSTGAAASTWSVSKTGNLLQISYGTPTSSPQYLALYLDSSYYRLNTGPGCSWGSSVILWPSYWSGGKLYQGGPVTNYTWTSAGSTLVLTLTGSVGTLKCRAIMRISAPEAHTLVATVMQTNTGNVKLDSRPNEAFKPVFVSSMKVSATKWDSYNLKTDTGLSWYPTSGFLNTPATTLNLQVTGGNSDWQINTPTLSIKLDKSRIVTGWVTSSADPNDDNVGIWAASSAIERAFSYTITATSN